MQAIRVLTITDHEGILHRVKLPEAARIVGEGDEAKVFMPVEAEYKEDFADENGLIEMSPRAILAFAQREIDGFSLVESKPTLELTADRKSAS